MAVAMHEVLFDPDMIRTEEGERFPVTGTLEFANTDLYNPLTGAHQININRLTALRKIVIQVKLVDALDSAYLQNFFMGGFAAIPFRFKYHPDYTATLEKFGDANGVLTEFYLKKTFKRVGMPHESVWRITKPLVQVAKETNGYQLLEADGTTNRVINTPLKIFRNGVEVTTGWTVNAITGVVTFAVAPATGALTWTGEFDIPVRFVGNSITHGFDVDSEVEGITLQEVTPYELGILV